MPLIEFEQVSHDYGVGATGGRPVVRDLDLRLTGRRIGIIGGNGSGKSTFARMLNALVVPTSGTVRVDGLDTRKEAREVRRRVGFCFTDPAAQVVMPTCVEDVELSLRKRVKDRVRRREAALSILDRFGLADRADVSVHALSGGQRQLLALAGVLATEPDLVVVDEPTTLLDLRNTRLVAETLFGLDQQLILLTHDLDLVQRCDRVLLVEDGRIAFDGPARAAVAHYEATV